MRRTEATSIYKRTKNLRAVQLLLGHSKLESTVRYLGIEVDDVPRDREIVVYCVYGHEVGRATALRLRAQGIKARFLRGGIDAWQAAGQPVDPKGAAS